jgi:chlorobactene glucosyltransferase
MIMFVVCLLPIWLVGRSPRPSFSAANGQFMLFRREAYEQIGGHEAVRQVVLEDVILARRIKMSGLKAILPDGTDSVSCRMYRSSQDVWQGFSKNLYAFFNYNILYMGLFMLLNLLAFVLPAFWLLVGWLTGQPMSLEWFWLPLSHIVIALIIRMILALRFGFRFMDIFLHPLSIIVMLIIGYNSVRWRKRGVFWKGRVYPSK